MNVSCCRVVLICFIIPLAVASYVNGEEKTRFDVEGRSVEAVGDRDAEDILSVATNKVQQPQGQFVTSVDDGRGKEIKFKDAQSRDPLNISLLFFVSVVLILLVVYFLRRFLGEQVASPPEGSRAISVLARKKINPKLSSYLLCVDDSRVLALEHASGSVSLVVLPKPYEHDSSGFTSSE